VLVPQWQPGYSLIQVEAASINQLSNTIRTGGFGDTRVPLIQGNDGAGTIIRSDRHPVGIPVTALGGRTYGVTENGLFAQYALIPLIAGDKSILGYSVNDEPATWVCEGLAAITDIADQGLLHSRIDTVVPLTDLRPVTPG